MWPETRLVAHTPGALSLVEGLTPHQLSLSSVRMDKGSGKKMPLLYLTKIGNGVRFHRAEKGDTQREYSMKNNSLGAYVKE